jgi:hypothetical protein
MRRISCAAALATTAFVGSIASADIVANGNFESNASSFSGYGSGTIPNWTATGGTGLGGAGITSSSTYAEPVGYNGLTDPSVFAYATNNRATDRYVEQAITLAPDTSYTLTFEGASKVRDFLPTSDPATGDMLVYDNAGNLTDVTITSLSPAGSDFTEYTANFTTGSDTTGATVELSITQPTPSDNLTPPYEGDFVDASDIAIAPKTTPEPSTWALILGGMGLLAARQLRRRNV